MVAVALAQWVVSSGSFVWKKLIHNNQTDLQPEEGMSLQGSVVLIDRVITIWKIFATGTVLAAKAANNT